MRLLLVFAITTFAGCADKSVPSSVVSQPERLIQIDMKNISYLLIELQKQDKREVGIDVIVLPMPGSPGEEAWADISWYEYTHRRTERAIKHNGRWVLVKDLIPPPKLP